MNRVVYVMVALFALYLAGHIAHALFFGAWS